MTTTDLHCTCGKVHLTVDDKPIMSVECCCTSCRTAGCRLEMLPGAPKIVSDNGATHVVMFRKDRVHVAKGSDLLKDHRLTPTSPTRRVIAGCCNTPMFLDFTKGHWLSLYGCLWTDQTRPPIELRTMTTDLPAGVVMPADVPNAKTQSFGFFVRLIGAWVAMGFKVPKVTVHGAIAA